MDPSLLQHLGYCEEYFIDSGDVEPTFGSAFNLRDVKLNVHSVFDISGGTELFALASVPICISLNSVFNCVQRVPFLLILTNIHSLFY